jgi:hypothetical protein
MRTDATPPTTPFGRNRAEPRTPFGEIAEKAAPPSVGPNDDAARAKPRFKVALAYRQEQRRPVRRGRRRSFPLRGGLFPLPMTTIEAIPGRRARVVRKRSGWPVWIRVLGAIAAAAHRVPLPITAARARRQGSGRTDVDRVSAAGASVSGGGNDAAGGDGLHALLPEAAKPSPGALVAYRCSSANRQSARPCGKPGACRNALQPRGVHPPGIALSRRGVREAMRWRPLTPTVTQLNTGPVLIGWTLASDPQRA